MNTDKNLFQLMVNLSQLKNAKQVINLFIENMNQFFYPVRFSLKTNENEIKGLFININIQDNTFGSIAVENIQSLSSENKILIQQSVQMLSVVLGQFNLNKKLDEKKVAAIPNSNENFNELRNAIAELKKARLASLNLIEDLTSEIEKRKKFEKELKESEERYRLVLDNSIDAVLLTGPDGMVYSANKAACKLFDMSEPEICNRGRSGLVDTSDPRLPLLLEERKRSGKVKGELTFLRKDKSKFSGEVSTSVFTDKNGNLRSSMIIRDITERKKIEETVEKNRKIMQLFIEYAPASIAMFDKNMIYLSVSKRFKYDYRLGNINVIGKSHYEIFPEISQQWKDIHNRCLKGESAKCDDDPFYRKDGDLDYIKWEIRPWFENPNEIGGIVLFSEVITDRRNTEAELRKLKSELEEQVELKTRELKIKVEELERFQDATIEREFRMKELRDEIEYLKGNIT